MVSHYLKTNRLKTQSPYWKPRLIILDLSSTGQYSLLGHKVVHIFKSKTIVKLDNIYTYQELVGDS